MRRPAWGRVLAAGLAAVPMLAAPLLAAGCGGGGGGGDPPVRTLDLGLLPGSVVTRQALSVVNPLGSAAELTEEGAGAPFRIDPAALPLTIGPGAAAELPLLCAPNGGGPALGLVTLRASGPGGTVRLDVEVRASFEAVTWSLAPAPVAFGVVALGESLEQTVTLTNRSSVSPVTLTAVQLPGPAFSLVGPALPVTIEPGRARTFALRYAPAATGLHDGEAVFGPADLGARVRVPMTAGEAPDPELVGEERIDLGAAVFTDGLTPEVAFEVPADAVSFTVEIESPTIDAYALESLTGPGGASYAKRGYATLATLGTGIQIFAHTVPDGDLAERQLVPGGGTYRVRFRLTDGTGASARMRVVLERRPSAVADQARLHLNVFLAAGLAPDASTAPADPVLTATLARVATIYAAQGITLGDVAWHDVTDASLNVVDEVEIGQLFQLSAGAAKTRANLFLVQGFAGQLTGFAGFSGRIGAPRRNATVGSGVAVNVSAVGTTDALALVIAHELGHALGLFHTIEGDGSALPDLISDTDTQPNLMAPTIVDATLTAGQGFVLRRHPHLAAPLPGSGKPGSGEPGIAPAVGPADLGALGPPLQWCGHCAAHAGGGAVR